MDNLVSEKLIYILKHSLKVSKLDLDTYLSFEGSILFCTFCYFRIIYIFDCTFKNVYIHYKYIIAALFILKNTYIISVKAIGYIIFYTSSILEQFIL